VFLKSPIQNFLRDTEELSFIFLETIKKALEYAASELPQMEVEV